MPERLLETRLRTLCRVEDPVPREAFRGQIGDPVPGEAFGVETEHPVPG